ncbi:MAG: glycosyltransferase [Spirosomataceae bacterium]
MRILSIGSFNGINNTSVHRNWGLQKIGEVDMVNMYEKPITLWYRIINKLFNLGLPVSLPDLTDCNKRILELINVNDYDIIWIDKGLLINHKTLSRIKEKIPNAKIVSYSPDNMALRHNQSQNYLDCVPHYDYIFTTKSYILEEMKELGARKIEFVNNAYEQSFHYPRVVDEFENEKLGGDVGFIGHWEKERCDSILYLANRGIKVKVFGSGKWNEYKNVPNLSICPPLFSEEYSKALTAFKISLCFLRKINGDQQTTRTMEIPACGGFMLAERTEEHLSLFEEGKEAEYFSSNEELLQKCLYYLEHEEERKSIAQAGYMRCKTSGYSNEEVVRAMIDKVMNND